MIQFVIAESTLLPYGKVIVPASNTAADSNGYFRYIGHEEFDINESGVKDGVDYHTLTYDNRAINLDTVIAPPGTLVTGVRFHVNHNKRLTLQIRVTKFNYETGNIAHFENPICS